MWITLGRYRRVQLISVGETDNTFMHSCHACVHVWQGRLSAGVRAL